MSEHIPHIDARKQPMGYITDHLLSEASKKRQFIMTAKIDNLTVTATITFEIEAVKADTSDNPLLFIHYKEPLSIGKSVGRYIHYGNVTVTNQNLKLIGHHPLEIDYHHRKFEEQYSESLRIKYKSELTSSGVVF